MTFDVAQVTPSDIEGQIWSPTRIRTMGTSGSYDVHPDGKRVAAAADQSQSKVQDHVVIMSNFFDYLRKIAPVKK